MSKLRLASSKEIENWDRLIVDNPNGGDVFQTKAFASIKLRQGWRPQFTIYQLANRSLACLYLTRQLPFLGELWYSPKGPGITSVKDLAMIVTANKQFAATTKPKIFAFKIEPEVPKVIGKTLIKVRDIQPNANTIVVDLKPDQAQILASFRQRARRAIRQAEAAGIVVKPAAPTQKNFQQMYNLYQATGVRSGFYVRDFAYHQDLWQQWVSAGQGQLFFAYDHDHVVAAAFVAFIGKKGLYKDGASDRSVLKNGAAHLLQWQIMCWLKKQGVTNYDLHGTPPADQLENKLHKFYGLGLFKTSFSNHITEFAGTLDQPIDYVAYKAWQKIGERAAQSLEYRLRGRAFY